MEKKKNFMKSNIVAFVLGALVFWAVNATAATLMESADVGYSNASSGSTATTVQGALDDLYAKTTPGTLTLGATNGTAVSITKGFYNKVNTTAVYNAGLAAGKTVHDKTYTLTSSETGTKDLTSDHQYRYINATNVYNKGKSDGVTVHSTTYTLTSSETGTKDLTASHSYRYINATNVYNKGVSDTKKGTAGAAQVLSGYTFTNSSSVNASGTMPSRSSSSNVKNDTAWHYSNRIYFGIDYGYYPSATYNNMSSVSEKYITYSSLASVIGLSANKIVSGNTILGIAGTNGGYDAGYNAGYAAAPGDTKHTVAITCSDDGTQAIKVWIDGVLRNWDMCNNHGYANNSPTSAPFQYSI